MEIIDYSKDFLPSLFEKTGLELSKLLIRMLATLTVCLLGWAKANLVSIAVALPIDGTTLLVCMQRIRRFLSNERISVALGYKGRAIPLFWIVFGRRGNTSLEHWKQVLAPVIEALKKPCYTRKIGRVAIADK